MEKNSKKYLNIASFRSKIVTINTFSIKNRLFKLDLISIVLQNKKLTICHKT